MDGLQQGFENSELRLGWGAVRNEVRPMPPRLLITGASGYVGARFVMLAWLLGRVRCEDVESTAAVFDAIAGASPLVKRTYYGIEPARGASPARLSSGFVELCRTSFARLDRGGGNPLDDLVLLRAPEALAEAFAREAGLPPPVAPSPRRTP